MSGKVSLTGRHALFRRLTACDHFLHVSRSYPYRVRIDFRPDGGIDRDVVDAIIADNVKAELTVS